MKLATWNVNSLRVREDTVLDWLEKHKVDVLCLQETKVTDQEFPEDGFGDLGYDVVYTGQRTYNGVAIVSRPEMFDVVKRFPDDPPDAEKRIIAATIDGVRVVSVYVPNGQNVGGEKYTYKLEWYRRLRRWLEETSSPDAPLVVCGDYNVAPSDLDVFDPIGMKGQLLASDAEREAFRHLQGFGLVDALRHVDPSTKRFTWWDYRAGGWERNLGLRIDHFLVTKPIVDRIASVTVDHAMRGKERASDHVPVILELK
ncbi:exodeoxyribonuclease III [Myxococcota bacterium]|nr:exodeoxyribonuclease III [Myxococcota bacterium]